MKLTASQAGALGRVKAGKAFAIMQSGHDTPSWFDYSPTMECLRKKGLIMLEPIPGKKKLVARLTDMGEQVLNGIITGQGMPHFEAKDYKITDRQAETLTVAQEREIKARFKDGCLYWDYLDYELDRLLKRMAITLNKREEDDDYVVAVTAFGKKCLEKFGPWPVGPRANAENDNPAPKRGRPPKKLTDEGMAREEAEEADEEDMPAPTRRWSPKKLAREHIAALRKTAEGGILAKRLSCCQRKASYIRDSGYMWSDWPREMDVLFGLRHIYLEKCEHGDMYIARLSDTGRAILQGGNK